MATSGPGRARSPFRISVRPGSDRDVVALAGEMDIATATQLRASIQRLLSKGRHSILVDLGDVTFFDGAAIHALLTATSAVARAGGDLQVTYNARCARLLDITGEIHKLHVTDGRDPDVEEDLFRAARKLPAHQSHTPSMQTAARPDAGPGL